MNTIGSWQLHVSAASCLYIFDSHAGSY